MGKKKSCAYCGYTRSLTKDHVPPQCLFPRPKPVDLITVSACAKCHGKTSKDDEYFRQCVSLADGTGDNPAAQWNREVVFRSLHRAESTGMRKAFIREISEVWRTTAGGIYLGRALSFKVDLPRIFRVVERTVRGLYFKMTERRLADGYDVMVHSNDTLEEQPEDVLLQLRETVLQPLGNIPLKTIGDKVFAYRHAITVEDPNVSVWALVFFEHIGFLAISGLKDRRARNMTQLSD